MKMVFGMLAAALLLSLTPGAQAWEPFTSEEGGFTIKMPSEPEHQEHDVPTAVGNVIAHMYMASDEETGAAYYAAFNDFPAAEAIDEVDTLLDSARDGMLANTGAELVSETEVEVPKGTCREIEAASEFAGQTVNVRVRVLLLDSRLYQYGAIVLEGSVDSSDIDNFLDSFELGE